MVALETTATTLQEDLERVLAAWLAPAGTCDRAGCEARLRFARAAINRLEVGLSRDACAFDRLRDSRKEERTADWLRRELSMSLNAANAALEVGLLADDMPESVAAAEQGRIGFGHLGHIAGVAEFAARIPVDVPDGELVMAGDVRPPVWTERELLAKAETQTIGKFATTCQDVQHRLDADAITRRLRTQMEAQRLRMWRNGDGSYGIHARLDEDNGRLFERALKPLAARRGADDNRPYGNRLAEGLGEMAMIALDAGKVPTTGGVRPHVSILAGVDTLSLMEGATAARAEEGGVLPDHVAQRIACNATVSRVLLDSNSVPIDVGRDTRVIPIGLHRALVGRDRGCRAPMCDVPPARCHAHHLVHWIEGGETNLANCLLLCRWHHRLVHEGRWEIWGDPNGTINMCESAEPLRHGPRAHNWLRSDDADEPVVPSDHGGELGDDHEGAPSLGRMLAWELAARRAEAITHDTS